jgi:polyisoprenoid-binding protein YceI
MSIIEQTQTLPAGKWTLDKVHSAAGFSVKHMVVATYRSQFNEVDATIEAGVLTGIVQAASIEAKDENLKGHLLSPEFFDTDNTPEIRFVSTDIRPDGDSLIVEGDLTIKGHTERVEARGAISEPYEDFTNTLKLGIDLETTVDRTAFGLNWNAPLPKGGFAVGNDVTIAVHLEFAPAAA